MHLMKYDLGPSLAWSLFAFRGWRPLAGRRIGCASSRCCDKPFPRALPRDFQRDRAPGNLVFPDRTGIGRLRFTGILGSVLPVARVYPWRLFLPERVFAIPSPCRRTLGYVLSDTLNGEDARILVANRCLFIVGLCRCLLGVG